MTIIDLNKELNKKNELYIRANVRPGLNRTEIKDTLADNTIKINIAAPAVKGKANQELIKFLAREFSVAKSQVIIISGSKGKVKLIKVIK